MNAPPFINIVAASGTCNTLKPIYYRTTDKVAKAVVLPAQGPPVKQILVIGCFDFSPSPLAKSSISEERDYTRQGSGDLTSDDEECCDRNYITLSTLSIYWFIVFYNGGGRALFDYDDSEVF